MAKVGRPKKNRDNELKELAIDLSKWLFLNPNSYGVRIAANELGLVLGKKKTTDSHANICRLKIGSELAAQLDIHAGDTICFYSNPDDLLCIAAVKRPNGNRISILDGKLLCVNFSFENRFGFKTERTKVIPYTIHKQGYLMFRIEGTTAAQTIVDSEEEILDE